MMMIGDSSEEMGLAVVLLVQVWQVESSLERFNQVKTDSRSGGVSGFGNCVGYNRTSGVITGDRSCSPGLESLCRFFSEFDCRFSLQRL